MVTLHVGLHLVCTCTLKQQRPSAAAPQYQHPKEEAPSPLIPHVQHPSVSTNPRIATQKCSEVLHFILLGPYSDGSHRGLTLVLLHVLIFYSSYKLLFLSLSLYQSTRPDCGRSQFTCVCAQLQLQVCQKFQVVFTEKSQSFLLLCVVLQQDLFLPYASLHLMIQIHHNYF